ncbi:MAG: DUF4893 domain-containing protein [Sphingomicrobium sp.]
MFPSRRLCWILAVAGAVASCASPPKAKPVAAVVIEPPSKSEGWRQLATPADESRLQRIGLAWASALQDANKGFAAQVRQEGVLLKPRAALARPAPTPGSYNCRLIKLGKVKPRAPAFEKFQPFFCYVEVEGDLLTIVKQTGDTRPAGRLWEDDLSDRLVFLGSLALGSEDQPKAYGDDPRRDMAGVLERVGPFVWRLVIPWPQGNSKLDVFELTPVEKQPE